MAETYTNRTLREIVRIIASRFLGMVLILLIVVGAVVVASLAAPKVYRSEVHLMAKPARVISPLEVAPTSQREEVSLFVSTQREIIRSDYVLGWALLMLEDSSMIPEDMPSEAGEEDQPRQPLPQNPQWESRIREYLATGPRRLEKLKTQVEIITPGGPDATFTQTFKIRVDWAEQRDSFWSSTQARQNAADNAYKLAEYITKAYHWRYSQLEVGRIRDQSRIGSESVDEAKRQLREAERQLSAFARELGVDMFPVVSIVDGAAVNSGITLTVTELDSQLNDLNAELARLTALRDAVDSELAKNDPAQIAAPDEVINANPSISLLTQRITATRLQINNLKANYTEEYKELVNLRDELSAHYDELRDEMRKQRERIQTTINLRKASRQEIITELSTLHDRMKKIGARAPEYDTLQRDVDAAINIYNQEREKYMESLRAGIIAQNPVLVSVMDHASRPNPETPIRPILWLNVLIGVAAGLVLGLVYAFTADHFNHTLKSIDDAERYLGTPVLASVPKLGRGIIQNR